MSKPTLLVVAPDEHYMHAVAEVAKKKGLIGDIVVVKEATQEDFAKAMDNIDKSNVIIAKGMPETRDFLIPILKYNDKELIVGGKSGLLTHCTILLKKYNWLFKKKPLIVTDAAINIAPTAEEKVKIAHNAIDIAQRGLGIARPTVSFLTPSGKLNTAIQSSVDADFAIKELEKTENAELRMDQMDTALSVAARKAKKMTGESADILITDNLDSGNIVYKIHTIQAGYYAAGLVCGVSVPTILNSRADSEYSKLLSIKYAIKLLSNKR